MKSVKKYSRNNGYYKYYNNKGDYCRIKIKNFTENNPIIVKFKDKDDIDWFYHLPDKKFNSVQEIIWYITNNLETPNKIFKIQSIDVKS